MRLEKPAAERRCFVDSPRQSASGRRRILEPRRDVSLVFHSAERDAVPRFSRRRDTATSVNQSDATRTASSSRAAIWSHSRAATANRLRSAEKNSDAVRFAFIRPSAVCAFDASR